MCESDRMGRTGLTVDHFIDYVAQFLKQTVYFVNYSFNLLTKFDYFQEKTLDKRKTPQGLILEYTGKRQL